MAEVTVYQLISNNNNAIFSDLKAHFSIFKTKKSSSFIYGIVLIFVFFTIFLAFSPSTSSSSPWFVNIFAVNSTSPDNNNNNNNNDSDGSNFSSVHSYFFPNSTKSSPKSQIIPPRSQINSNFQVPNSNKSVNLNYTQVLRDKVSSFEQNNQSSSFSAQNPKISENITVNNPVKQANYSINSDISPQVSPLQKNQSKKSGEISSEKSPIQQNNQSTSQISSTPHEIQSNSTERGNVVNSSDLGASLSKKQGKNNSNVVKSLVGCNLYDGNWVKDESYPLYKPGSCDLVDEQFNCLLNGRPDNDFQKLRWNPKSCSLPRLNGGNMLKLLRGKRLVFVGDSLNRNMWESLVCILKNSVKDKKKVYEAFGRHHFRTEASYSYVFEDYNCTVEFFVSPFLVQQWEVKDKNGTTTKETLRLDLMVSDADQFKGADFLVFNTGHWWTHDKTSKGEDYYQEGTHVYKHLDVNEAFRRAITTWARWVDANVNPQKTHVLFRGYSASHFSGGQWNSGGQCDSETEPIRKDTYLTEYPTKMKMFESVINGMKIPVAYLNVTRLTDYRKDGHPSVYRKQHLTGDEKKSPLRYQDCSHWCLPGVPDSWNELLYAELLRKQYVDQHQKIKS